MAVLGSPSLLKRSFPFLSLLLLDLGSETTSRFPRPLSLHGGALSKLYWLYLSLFRRQIRESHWLSNRRPWAGDCPGHPKLRKTLHMDLALYGIVPLTVSEIYTTQREVNDGGILLFHEVIFGKSSVM